MPLSKRVIPCLDVDAGRVVKGVSFKDLKDAGDPVELAQRYCEEGADELVFLDITASIEGRKTTVEVVREVAEVLEIPFTVGGGIRGLSDAHEMLVNGADKVAVNTAAIKDPQIIKAISRTYGDQCVVLAIDAKRERVAENRPFYRVYSHGGSRPTQLEVVSWAKTGEELGAGEILLTSIDMDGTRQGYDVELLKLVSDSVNIPVIASGGGGSPEHMYEAITRGGADAVLAASIFHFGQYTIREIKDYLRARGVLVRL